MKNLTLSILLIVALSGCSSLSTFNPRVDKVFFSVQFHNSIESIEAACGKGVRGCYKCNPSGSVCNIQSIKERCVLDHEVDHVLFGDFHRNKLVNCKTRSLSYK